MRRLYCRVRTSRRTSSHSFAYRFPDAMTSVFQDILYMHPAASPDRNAQVTGLHCVALQFPLTSCNQEGNGLGARGLKTEL